MDLRKAFALLLPALLAFACAAPGATPAPVAIPAVVCTGVDTTYQHWIEGTLEISEHDPIEQPADMDGPNDLLNIVRERGVLIVSTDPEYPPQSALTPEGEFEGFDIDVATEIAERLGVEVQFETPSWDAITAGSWAGRWDISVGSMTITDERKERLSFTQPYYFTPAQIAVATRTGIQSVAELPFNVPDDVEVTTLPTDVNCAEAINAGRTDFDLWMSAFQTIQEALDEGMPVRVISEPYFTEPLSVAIDKSGPPHAALLYEIDRIIGEMHADGTLSEFSMNWYGEDITKPAD